MLRFRWNLTYSTLSPSFSRPQMRKVSKFSQRREFTSEGISGPLDWTGRITWFNSQPQYEEHLEVQKLDWLITVTTGLPWQSSGYDCELPLQGPEFDPCSGN